ncbi:hypothetical protein [Actinoplanes awajinensis]|uniref:PH domain-containing protein n=1 Tax=Actinoplanes awajinensis subsp. mycoplanecinus TaxID=135947 RepID=A0A124G888_9ACTN|nr:hypothetical protein [Actinoplanes awajinensis]KUL25136.1 hypothetical protein ADL15_41350 [Actinoplanes awajinensis subsp. mycoplanecinus]
MIIRLSAATDRRRALIPLLAAAVTAALVAASHLPGGQIPAVLALLVECLTGVGLGLAVTVAAQRTAQAAPAFVVDERTPALHSTRTGALPLLSVAMVSVLGIAVVLPPLDPELRPVMWPLGAFAAVFLILCGHGILRGLGVSLTPDGVRADKLAGAVTVPWEAVDPVQIWSGPFEVRIRYRRPELVRTTGWVVNPNRFRVDGSSPAFTAATVQHYAANPDQRVLIGAPAGQLHPSSTAAEPPRSTEPWNPSTVVPILVLAVLIGAGALAGDLWLGATYGNTSVAGLVAHVLAVLLALVAARFIRGSVRLLRRR